jgi:hypothetical protein
LVSSLAKLYVVIIEDEINNAHSLVFIKVFSFIAAVDDLIATIKME